MDVTKIPFNNFIGIKRSNDKNYILQIEEDKKYHNHLQTIHASVQFALAEATSGDFLLNNFIDYKNNIIPVVRRTELKYSIPAKGKLYSKAYFAGKSKDEIINELKSKTRLFIPIEVKIFDEEKNITLHSTFHWFIQKM